MNTTLRCGRIAVVILVWITTMISQGIAEEWAFRGKLIDTDTREPIEGSVVVAYWASLTDETEVKEALTNKNGEWSIVGKKGRGKRIPPYPLPLVTLLRRIDYYTGQPVFIIFKPGYESFDSSKGEAYTFLAFPYVNKKRGTEGIILSINEKDENNIRKHIKGDLNTSASLLYGLPFLPMRDPEKRLRSLEIPFDYSDNVARVYENTDGFLNDYTLLGLKRLVKKEDRARALQFPLMEYFDGNPGKEKQFLEKQKHFIRLFEEENKYLGIDHYKHFKEKLEE